VDEWARNEYVGAVARYKLSGLVLHHATDWRFPLPTFIVNVLGCIVAGVLAGAIERYGVFTRDTRLFLFSGLLGGFTTFSAFGVERAGPMRRGEYGVALSVVCGVGAIWLAIVLAHRYR
jgi:fluoride exporter